MRTESSAKNLAAAIAGQAVALGASFFARTVFLRFLGKEYLGISGLFTNVLTVLSLVELGIGPAIIYSLYRPLAENDVEKIRALMALFKKAYTLIGLCIMVLGAAITPFLQYLITGLPDIPNLKPIFLLFALNSSISYFYSYKRSLIIADQNRYIATIYRYGFFSAMNIAQIAVLIAAKSYLLFLFAQVLFTFLENIAVSRKADKMYPYLRERPQKPLDRETLQTIRRNTAAMVLHKIGGIAVNSTDNILTSIMIGTVWVGLCSNYQLIIDALQKVIDQVFLSISASVGNMGATESEEKSRDVFYAINLLGFWIFGFCSISFYVLANPFITLWLGKDMLLPNLVVLIVSVNFYINGMRRSVGIFRDAYGLYWQYRYKPLFEAAINLTASVVLAPILGVTGILLGATISALTTCFWVEPLVVFKFGLQSSCRGYFLRYFLYTLALLAAACLCVGACESIPAAGIAGLALRAALCLLIPNALFLALFYKTKEFAMLFNKLRYIFARVGRRGF